MLKEYITGVDSYIGVKICYNNYFTEKLANELHYWVENHPHVFPSKNVSEKNYVKKQGNYCKQQNHLFQIYSCQFCNDLIVLVAQGGFIGTRVAEGRVCIGD